MKLVCPWPMILDKTNFKRFARTLVRILNNTLHKLIGLKWLKDSGFSDLGISTSKVELRETGNLPDAKACWTNSMTWGPKISHWLWKKKAFRPSFPAALEGLTSNTALLTSSAVTALLSNSISSLEMGRKRPLCGYGGRGVSSLVRRLRKKFCSPFS